MKFAVGIFIGFTLAALFAPWNAQPHDGKTAECVEHKPWLMSKKYACTPAEAAALRATTPPPKGQP